MVAGLAIEEATNRQFRPDSAWKRLSIRYRPVHGWWLRQLDSFYGEPEPSSG